MLAKMSPGALTCPGTCVFASYDKSGQIQLLDPASENVICCADLPKDHPLVCVLVAPSGLSFAALVDYPAQSKVSGGQLIVFSAVSGSVFVRKEAFSHSGALAYTPDGQNIAVGDEGGHLHIFTVESGAERQGASPLAQWVQGLAYSPCGQQLAVGYGDGRLQVLKVQSWEPLATADIGVLGEMWQTESHWCLAYAPDGCKLAVMDCVDHALCVLNPKTGAMIFKLEQFGLRSDLRFPDWPLSYAPSGPWLAVSMGGSLHRFNTDSGEVIQKAVPEFL